MENPNGRVVVAQLTDLHLFDDPNEVLVGMNTEASFQEILADLLHRERSGSSGRPDLLLLTGDLLQKGGIATYRRLRQHLLQTGIPTCCVPGNHDDMLLMRAHLFGDGILADRSLPLGAWRLLLLCSAVPDRVEGYLSDDSLTWLDNELSDRPQTPTLIAFHHPALPLGSAWMDKLGLQNREAFWQICDRHPQVKIVVNGHAHQEFELTRSTDRGQIRYLVSPSTCVQFVPQNPQFLIDTRSPGYRLLYLCTDGTVETEVCRLPAGCFQPDLQAVGY